MPAGSNPDCENGLQSDKLPAALVVSFRFVFIFCQVPRGKMAACNLNGLTRCSSVVSARLGSGSRRGKKEERKLVQT